MRPAWVIFSAVLLAACSSVPQSERPVPLPHYANDLAINDAWSRLLGAWRDPPEGQVEPLVANGELVVVDGLDWLHAFDARSGKLRWERRTGDAITGGIAASGDDLLVGTLRGEVMAFALKDGALHWQTTLSSEILTPPTVAGGVAVIRTGDGKVYALNSADGKQLWTFERAMPTLSLRGTGRAVIAGDQVFAGFASGKLAALNLKDGSLLWETAVATPQGRSELERIVDVDADPVVVGDTVYAVAYHGRLVALSREGGGVLWARDMSAYENMAVDEHAIYLSDDHGAVWAVDRGSGAALWKQVNLRNRGVSAPVLFGNYLVVADFQGYLHWMARDDGRLVGRYRADDAGTVGAPYAADNLLYVLERGGGLEVLTAVPRSP